MTQETTTTYDEVPYESMPFTFSHPDRLATMATLFGLKPVPLQRCRVLELGCAAGGNLVPMAMGLPESKFVGIDLSRRQIEDGQKLIATLGLINVELQVRNILDVGPDFGEFDYIICHGVYSWIPAAVQDKVLAICASNLSAAGLAYVSYNTYPGWHMRRLIRELMCLHGRQFADPLKQVQQARAFLDFLGSAIPDQEGSTYPALVRSAAAAMRDKADYYLLHEYLEEYNEPCYLHQFVSRAKAHGLQYIADAKNIPLGPGQMPPQVEQTLRQLARERVQLEQYLDLVQNRAFRQSVLCPASATLAPAMQADAITRLYITSTATPTTANVNLHSGAAETFRTGDLKTLTTSEPLLKLALAYLGQVFPQALTLEELMGKVRNFQGAAPRPQTGVGGFDTQLLCKQLLHAFEAGLVELRSHMPQTATAVSERPTASPLARLQVAAKQARPTNLRHEVVDLNEFSRKLLGLLDGSRDRAALRTALAGATVNGAAGPGKAAGVIEEPLLAKMLSDLARSSLLVG